MLMIAALPRSTKPSEVLSLAKTSQFEAEKAKLRMRKAAEYGDATAYREARSTYKRAINHANAWHKAWRDLLRGAA